MKKKMAEISKIRFKKKINILIQDAKKLTSRENTKGTTSTQIRATLLKGKDKIINLVSTPGKL